MTPLVSVAIPTYNQPQLLSAALESVFAQTLKDYEIVVVNDGSTDNTQEVLAGYGARIRVINQENAWIGAARNRAIAACRGKYVATLDHDDLWLPEKLETQVAYYEQHPECSMVTVPYAQSTDPEHSLFDAARYRATQGLIDRPLLEYAQGQTIMMTSALMFNRERAAGIKFGEMRNCTEDHPFQIALCGRGPVGVAGERVLMIYRVHAQNFSRSATYSFNGICHLRKMARAGQFNLSAVQKKDLRLMMAQIGRSTVAGQIIGNARAKALLLYAREFFYQVQEKRWRFLLGMPILIGAPRRVQRRMFKEIE